MIEREEIISDKDADNSIKSLDAIPVIPAVIEFFKSNRVSSINDEIAYQKDQSKAVNDTEIHMLRVIMEHPMLPSSQYSKLAHISPNTFKKVQLFLKDKGLISEHKLQANIRGRSTILLGPTEQGKDFLNDYDKNKRSS